MRGNPLGGLTIRAAVILGFSLMVTLWVVTGYQFTRGLADAERKSAETASRYVQAQEALSSLRPHVLAASGIVRDALFESGQSPPVSARADLESELLAIDGVVRRYRAPIDSADERERLHRLSGESDHFARVLRRVMETGALAADGRALFAHDVLPRRTDLLVVTEDLQAVNRATFLRYQNDRAAEHGAAELQAAEHLGFALLFSVAIAAMATLYSARLEKRLRSQLQQDAMKTRALQDLSIKMIRAQEDERRRIARELHDEVGQALTAIKVELTIAERAIGASAAAGALNDGHAITDGALHSGRDLSRLLHPAALDDLGLPEAVDAYLRDFSRRYGIRTELRHEGMAARLAGDIEVAAYRMIQEALTNVARHARASHCDVRLQRSDDRFEVVVRDDGEGFSLAQLNAGESGGVGLIGMRERALQLAGMVSIDSTPGAGTVLRILLPARGRHGSETGSLAIDLAPGLEPSR